MKIVEWEEDGRKHRAKVRDDDSPQVAVEGNGVSLDPPDIDLIDWEQVKRDLHNQLLERGLITHTDVEEQQNGVTGAVLAALRPKVLTLYRR